MKQYPAKLKLIFLPFLFLSAATIVVYTFLHWLLFIKTVIVPVDEDILNFWGPMVFPGIPILIWLRPRIKLLNLKNKSGKGDPLGGFIFFLWIAMAVPVIIAQSYLVTASGKLTELDSISQISKLPATKYYKVKHYYIDKNLVAFSTRFTTSGKYNQNFDMYIYAAVPVFDVNRAVKTHHFKISSPHSTINSDNALIVVNGRPTSRDSLEKINPRAIKQITVLKGPQAKAIYGDDAKDGAILIQTNPFYKGPDTLSVVNDGNSSIIPDAWIGVKFEKTISNKLTPDQKQGEYEDFAKSSQKDFNAKKLDSFIYLDRVAYGEDQKGYLKAINKNDFYTSNNPRIILNTVNEPFEARNGQKLLWIFGSFAIGAVVFMLLLLIKPLRNGVDLQTEETNANVETRKELQLYFWPKKGFYFTPLIIDANILIFIIMVFAGLGFISFQAHDLLTWGGNFRPAIDKGEYWRLLTNVFLHGGLMHVLFNMYGLFFVGIFLEPKIGSAKFLFAYLLTGIVASIASVWWHPATVSIGASGAIFGLYGVFLALITVNVYSVKAKKALLINTSIFIGYNLLFGLTGGVDNAAHIGGLLSGVILGYIMYLTLKDKVPLDEADAETKELMDELNEKPQELSSQETK